MAEPTPFLRVIAADEAPAPPPPEFPPPFLAPWLRASRRIAGAGYGAAVVRAYETAGPGVARTVGPEAAILMADTLSAVVIKAGRRAGELLAAAAPDAAVRLGDAERFRGWLGLVQRFAAMAPESTAPVLERMSSLLSVLNLSGLEGWLLAGVRDAGSDADKRRAFFSFDTPETARWLAREAGDLVFADNERRFRAYLAALFGVTTPVREPQSGAPEQQRRRPGFSEALIRMPSTFPGYRGGEAEDVFRAALAHVGAHARHSKGRSAVGGLKPVQVAVVSLIEDARVERLAMRELPGLARLWLPFHIAHPAGPQTAASLFARLSRALIDPDFNDPSGWVRKGRDLFHAAEGRLDDPAIARHIGNLLGNDLGQMRVQFDAKTYVVEPPYRDDNHGLWTFPDDEPPPGAEAEAVVETMTLRQASDAERPDRERDDGTGGTRTARLAEADPDVGIPAARHPEYDYLVGRERADWVTVNEYAARPGPAEHVAAILERNRATLQRIAALIKAAKVSRPQRLRRQAEGDTLDLDAVLDAAVDRRTGQTPDERVYQTTSRRQRSLSVLVLLDVSQSTADRAKGQALSVLDLEREATLLLAEAMAGLGDDFAIAAFSSNRRDDVRYTRIKDFDEPYGTTARRALSGLRPGYSTRLGTALRHAARDLATRQTFRRLVLVVSDGEPSDLDCTDRKYLVEDARRAVHTLAARGIDTFCIGLDGGGEAYLARIFGQRGAVTFDRIERLPRQLPLLYLRLTA